MATTRKSKTRRVIDGLGDRSIVLVGMMGSGKSAIGKMLATKLGIEFRDSDAEIELAAGRSVADIFEEYGEAEFRRVEERVISRLLSEGPLVLALGGGAFMNEATREAIDQRGVSVWLDVELGTLLERVMRKPGKRPLLSKGDPAEILGKLLEKRTPIYSDADVQVTAIPGTKSDMRNHVLDCLDRQLAHEISA
ncbi:MAG: shikimate kinase [Pseudomonadota bacterium]